MNHGADRLLTANEQLICVSTALSDLVEESIYAAHLKDTQTGRYIQANAQWMKNLGFESPSDFVGLNVNDFASKDGIWTNWNFSPYFNDWKNSIPSKVNDLEYQVQTKREVLRGQCISFTPEGFLLVEEWMKLPVLSKDRKKTIALLSYNHDVTLQRSLNDLFQLYIKYHTESNAVQKLLMYLNIDGYFKELPTLEEMNALIGAYPHYSLLSETDNAVFKSLQDKVENEYWDEMLMRLCALPINMH